MNEKLMILSIAAASILFTGCGGGGSSSSGPSIKSISGNVIDPAVKGATVSLKCGASIYNASNTTDENGAFIINNISSNTDLNNCTILATGGSDGDDLTGLTLKAPYKLFNKESGILVTPFTSAVAEHNNLNTNVEIAKQEVADFLGTDINIEDITKNPTSNVKLAKIAKKMTKIALSKNKDGKLIGYIDIDDTNNVTQNNLDNYVTIDLDDDLETAEKEKLQDELAAVNKAQSVDEVIKQSILGTTLNRLQRAYKKEAYTEQELTNLESVAEKIVEANKQNKKYRKVTRNHIRKALIDLDITPAFSDQEQKVLEENLSNTLKFDSTEFVNTVFKEEIDGKIKDKVIDILNVNNLTLFNADSYEQVVGDDNNKRINYYTLSNKSTIAKALELAEDSFSDDVNDPINAEISVGLAKNGLEDLAIEHIEESIYTRDEKNDAFKNLAISLLDDNKFTEAIISLEKQYTVQKQIIAAKGVENVKNFGDIQAIARRLSKAGDEKKAEEVITYLTNASKNLNTSIPYARIPQALRDLSQTSFIINNHLGNAKKYAKLATESIKNMPRDNEKTVIYNYLNMNLIASVFGDYTFMKYAFDESVSLDKDNKTFNATNSNGEYTHLYRTLYISALGLSDNFNQAYDDFKKLTKTRKDDALYYGISAGMALNGKINELKNYYSPTYFTKGIDDLFKLSLEAKEVARMNVPDILKARGRNDILEAYIDELVVISNSDVWKNNSKNDYDKLYAGWGNTSSFQASYIRVAQLYKELNKLDKANNIITISLEKVTSFEDIEKKLESYINLLWGLSEINMLSDENLATILTNINTTAKEATGIQNIVRAANYLTKYKKVEDAKVLLSIAETLINEKNSGNLITVKNRVKYLVGINNSAPKFVDSIANGYLQVGNKDKAIEIIQTANEDVETLVQGSTDQSKLYIDIANAYAGINDLANVKIAISKIKTSKELDKARAEAAKYLANYDAFSNIDVASIDSDGDGKPDFFNLGYSNEDIINSGLELDEDIDKDGIADVEDTLPYDNIK